MRTVRNHLGQVVEIILASKRSEDDPRKETRLMYGRAGLFIVHDAPRNTKKPGGRVEYIKGLSKEAHEMLKATFRKAAKEDN
jgi:hypothetical protein